VRHRLELLIFALVSAGVRLMPMSAVRGCGRVMGRAVSIVDRFHRRIALDNIAQALPVRSERERVAVMRGTFEHFGRLLLELIRFSSLTPSQMLSLVEIEGEEHLRQAYQQGRGVLFFTGHFGYWEIQAIAFALHEQPISVLARALDNPYLHDRLERIRTCTGNAVIYRQGAIRRVLRELDRNRGVAILIDQHLHSDAVQVDFFNRPAATTSALAALALRTGAPVIPVFALPLPGGRYRLMYEAPVTAPAKDCPDPVRDFTQRCTDVLEMHVRKDPHLWLWMHRRWREPVPETAGEG
jgi:KDO2-lipid IV(A) lauroyltransferase